MKRLMDEISTKVDVLVSAYKGALQCEESCRAESVLAKKLLIIKESEHAINLMKKVNAWAESNLKNKGAVFHNNYISINFQYKVYMEAIFKNAVESGNTMFAKAMLEKNAKLLDFNGLDCFNHCPINIAISLKNKPVFDYLIRNVKEKGHGLIINFANDTNENKERFGKVRTLHTQDYVFEASPLFIALSLFNKDDKNCELSHFVNTVVANGGVDLPEVLYRNIPSMKNVIDFIEVYREGIQNGFDKCEYKDVLNIVPVVSQNFYLGPNLATGIKIEDFAPANYKPENEFVDITIYEGADFDIDD